jgi:hypothetical protein
MIFFLHIPKTAGTTFEFILENNFGFSHCHTDHTRKKKFQQADLDFARKIFPRLRSIAGHNLVDPLQLSAPNPFHLTFLRDPVERVFSQYQEIANMDRHAGKNPPTFEEALRRDERYENLHVKLMAGERNLDKAKHFLETCGFVGLTEKFDLSLRVLNRLAPCKLNLNYQLRRAAKDNSSKAALRNDRRLTRLARELNQLDIQLYDFAANVIFPKLSAQAGLDASASVASFENYTHEIRPKFLLSRFWNQSIYRQLCKLKYMRLTARAGNAF